jgi:hypothetical protein
MVSQTVHDFVLTEFNTTITMDISGAFDASYSNIGDASGVVTVNINRDDWASCFKITGDSIDISNVDATDIQYYVYDASNSAGLKASHYTKASGIPGNSDLLDGNPAMEPVTSTPIDAGATRNELEYDFIRHIALDLFSTANGVDLFINETELRRSIEVACDGGTGFLLDQLAGILAAAEANGAMINGQSGNLTYTLLTQLLSKQSTRFASYALSADTPTALPWEIGDTIWYLLTINAATDQHLLVRNTTSVASRTYLVKMVLSA